MLWRVVGIVLAVQLGAPMGCYTTRSKYRPPPRVKRPAVRPAPKPIVRRPVAPPPKRFKPSCLSGAVPGCDRLQRLKQDTDALRIAHEDHMQTLERLTRQLGRLLSAQVKRPNAAISVVDPEVGVWDDPNGVYPATLILELEYARGLERLESVTLADVKSAVKSLKDAALKVAEDWRQLIVLSKAKVPAEILSQRRLVKVEITFRGLRAEFELPLFLAQRHLKRDQQAWTAIASHVVTDGALKHRIVQEHRVGTQDAFIVQAEFSARVPRVRITETPAGELRKQFVSQVPVADFCKNLRAELRFVPLNQLLPKKVEFRPAAKSGGAR